jgi:hypothetical protein
LGTAIDRKYQLEIENYTLSNINLFYIELFAHDTHIHHDIHIHSIPITSKVEPEEIHHTYQDTDCESEAHDPNRNHEDEPNQANYGGKERDEKVR